MVLIRHVVMLFKILDDMVSCKTWMQKIEIDHKIDHLYFL
jgi:hypothetical protein